MEELIPWHCLKGVSTSDFSEAWEALLGKDAPGFSASTVMRLKDVWKQDYEAWNMLSLEGKRYVYIWADGIHFNVRLEEDRICIFVIMGATVDSDKELIAVADGYRESEMSWKQLLLGLRDRGLTIALEIAIGDGALGFWIALEEIYPEAKWQRCWVHKTANVLDKPPKSEQSKAKGMLHEIYNSETKVEAEKAFDRFVEVHDDKYERAVRCLVTDHDKLLTFYDCPAQHWSPIRLTDPIESTGGRLAGHPASPQFPPAVGLLKNT